MLNLFPIQWLALLAYFILRVLTAVVLTYFMARHIRVRHELATTLTWSWFPFGKISAWSLILSELIISLSLLFGFLTQIGALLLIVYGMKLFFINHARPHSSLPTRATCVLFIAIGMSLFITGAGAFAFDLPI